MGLVGGVEVLGPLDKEPQVTPSRDSQEELTALGFLLMRFRPQTQTLKGLVRLTL